ncbi:hypothetical protein [Allomesorhizobium alhagi]|nr:hypothetical protein [Mesorhizobium alhagi]
MHRSTKAVIGLDANDSQGRGRHYAEHNAAASVALAMFRLLRQSPSHP